MKTNKSIQSNTDIDKQRECRQLYPELKQQRVMTSKYDTNFKKLFMKKDKGQKSQEKSLVRLIRVRAW